MCYDADPSETTMTTGERQLIDDTRDLRRVRGTARMISTAIDNGHLSLMHFSAEFLAALPKAMEEALAEATAKNRPRVVSSIATAYAKLALVNLSIVEAKDKSDRLDAGEATELVGEVSPETDAIMREILRHSGIESAPGEHEGDVGMDAGDEAPDGGD